MTDAVPFQFMECARVFVSQAHNNRFVIKCNYCNEESTDWLVYVGHLHGDHMPVGQEVDVDRISGVTVDNMIVAIQSPNTVSVLQDMHRDDNGGKMIEEHLDLDCSSVGETYDDNSEQSEGDLDDDFDLESDLNINSSEATCASIVNNNQVSSSPPSNTRFFQLRTTPINTMMKFIDILRQNPLQWDNTHHDYANKQKRNQSSLQLSQQIKRHLNINITARAARGSALALILWFQREYTRFVTCEVNDLQFVSYRREYFEKLMQFLPLKQLRTLSCDKCQRCFKSEHLLLSHKYKYHKGEAPFSCRYCERVFVHPSSLKLHENRHIKIDLWPCTECLYQSSSKADYLKHLASHSPEQPYKCDICGLAYKTSTNLSVHKRSHKLPEYECNICQKQFYENYRYKRHLWQHNEGEMQPSGEDNRTLNAFNCTLCGRRFTSRQTLLKHQVVHMLENYNLDGHETDVPQNIKEQLQLDYCDYCSLEFISNEAYGAHMMLKHGE